MDGDTEGSSQGSVLGSVFFNIFIGDLAYLISNDSLRYFTYADDNTLSAHAADTFGLQLAMESETVKIIDWFKFNCMKANPSKFQMFTVGLDSKSDFKFVLMILK